MQGFGSHRPPLLTVDGFAVQDNINFLPAVPDPAHNPWSYGKTITVEVWYGDYWQNLKHGKYRRKVTWKGRTVVVEDYEWFQMLIKQWITNTWYPKTKEEALDLFFEMEGS
jgi:hypothetical protein